MSSPLVLLPEPPSAQMATMLEAATRGTRPAIIKSPEDLPSLEGRRLLFAADLNPAGFNLALLEWLSRLWERGPRALAGAHAGLLLCSPGQHHTKDFAHSVVYAANSLGCRFPGHPLVEAVADLVNFRTAQEKWKLTREEICREQCRHLGQRVLEDSPGKIAYPRILALHASSFATSNTLNLWHRVRSYLENYPVEVAEYHVESGTIVDCAGCPYPTCKHYATRRSCFYGGVMVKELMPAIEDADVLVWVCPNYNDSISAHLMAVINRLTVLYRRMRFYHKTIFAVVVSGSSGGDSVAKQLLGALNLNKSFRLPPQFALMEVAHQPGEISTVPGIEERSRAFANHLQAESKA